MMKEKRRFSLKVLSNRKYVKTKPLTDANKLFLEELREAVEDVKLIKAGKLKGRPVEDY